LSSVVGGGGAAFGPSQVWHDAGPVAALTRVVTLHTIARPRHRDMKPGTRLGPYEIIDAIGHGGMGEVYRARDVRLHRQVAIKTLAAHAAADPQFHERFDREARAVAALSHPNILAIHDVGSHEGIPYVAVELLEGRTLRSSIEGSPLPLSTVVDYAVQIGRGLAAAHDRGIVHRDLKPENIFVTRDGQIKLLDFGLATEPTVESADGPTRPPQTEQGMLLGTAGYMSPEQARGERIDPRTDIFSFGCVLYEMVSGRRAFMGDSRIETLHAILKEHPPDLSSLRADVSPTLDRVIRRCLEKAPESRFQTARDLVFALESLADGSERRLSAAATAPLPRRARRWTAAALVAGVVVAGAAALWWGIPRNRPAAGPAANSAPAAERPRLLAVLPFENISPGGQGTFAAGMTEEVTNQLSKLSGLRVISRAAVASFKDGRAELPRMVKELGIGSIVAGTVREDATRVRVNVELIEASSGQVIWSEQYDREGVDVFAAQSDIALHVAKALNASVTLDEQARLGKRPTSSVAAYELFVRARTAPGKTSEERISNGIDLLRQAIALDPQFAEAYSLIANRSYFQAAYGDLSAFARGMEAAQKALAIDPQLASAHHGLAMNLHQVGRLQEALRAHRKAIELNPSYSGGLYDIGFSEATAGHYDEALRYAKRAAALNSAASSTGNYHIGVALLCLDDDARTERYLTAGAARFPNNGRLQALLSFLDLRRGQSQSAVDRIRAAADKAPNNIELLLTRAEVFTFAGARDAAEVVRALLPRAADAPFHNAPYRVKLAHAYHLQRAGSTSEAAKILDEIAEANRKSLLAGADWPLVFMEHAAVLALRGQTTAALDELERGYAAGWRDGRTLAIDPLFASVRAEPRFTLLLSRIEADVAAMRARADYSGLPD
jgi:TolB-like protein/Flp pilus assembly protein TadD